MAFNFPPSPSNGDTYTANGFTYEWDGSKWIRKSPSTGAQGGTGPTGAQGATGATGARVQQDPQVLKVQQDLQDPQVHKVLKETLVVQHSIILLNLILQRQIQVQEI